MNRANLIKMGFILLAGLFIFSLVNLFVLRFKSGDIYPPYSSFRTDPLGTKVLYEALTHIDPFLVDRNFKPSDQIAVEPSENKDICLIVAGLVSGPRLLVTQKEADQIFRITGLGGRIIIALSPRMSAFPEKGSKPCPPKKESTPKDSDPKTDAPDNDMLKKVDLYETFGIDVQRSSLEHPKRYAVVSQPTMMDKHQLSHMRWYQTIWFKPKPSSGWETIYSIQDEEPVIIEKQMGTGSIVLLADSYILSNESLKKDQTGGFLAWLINGKHGKSRILFDEYHLGVQKKQGISSLITKYGLYGPIGLCVILAGLIIWRASATLIPPDETQEMELLNHSSSGAVGTTDHVSGLTSLLKQHIPRSTLIAHCIEAWKQTFVLDNQASEKYARQYEKIQSFSGTKGREKENYIQICSILSEKERL